MGSFGNLLRPVRQIMSQDKSTERETSKIMDVVFMLSLVSVALWLLYVFRTTFG